MKKYLTIGFLMATISVSMYADVNQLAVNLKDIKEARAGINKQLFNAIEGNNLNDVKNAFQAGADIKAQKAVYSQLNQGDIMHSPLGWAINHQANKDIVQLIWDKTSDADREKVTTYPEGMTVSALGEAIAQKQDDIVAMILNTKDYIPNIYVINYPSGEKTSALTFNEKHGTTSIGIKIKEYLTTALFTAIDHKNLKSAEAALEFGAMVSTLIEDEKQPYLPVYTALGYAIEKNNENIVKAILKKNPNLKEVWKEKSSGKTKSALELAAGKENITKLLTQHLQERLIDAINDKSLDKVKNIVESGARVDNAIFGNAIKTLNVEMVKYLKDLKGNAYNTDPLDRKRVAEKVKNEEKDAEKRSKIEKLISDVWPTLGSTQKTTPTIVTQEHQQQPSWFTLAKRTIGVE